jgi:hypothetical protein
MASENFAFGHASDRLIEICCPGIKAIGITSREFRRGKKRKAEGRAFSKALPLPAAKGFRLSGTD